MIVMTGWYILNLFSGFMTNPQLIKQELNTNYTNETNGTNNS